MVTVVLQVVLVVTLLYRVVMLVAVRHPVAQLLLMPVVQAPLVMVAPSF